MTLTPEQLITIIVPIVLGLAWLFRLQSRQDVTDSRYVEIINRLERIEDNQDRREVHRV